MATEILRPNAAGDETNIPYQWPDEGEHWDKVDEATPDDGSTYIRVSSSQSTYLRDLYNLPAHSGSGTINFIKVWARCLGTPPIDQAGAKIAIKTGGTAYESAEITLTANWANYSNQWNTNPQTGQPWTWDDIDALQIGVALRMCYSTSGYSYSECTQVYVEVDYTSGVTEKSSSDTGSGADARASGHPVATLVKAETGSGSDILSQAQAILEGAETGGGVDAIESLQTPTAKTSADVGSGTEAVESLQAPQAKTSADVGSGAEGISVQSAILVGSESGAGIEAIIARLLAGEESGSAAEASSLETDGQPKDLFASELGEGCDRLVAKIAMPTKGGGMKLWT